MFHFRGGAAGLTGTGAREWAGAARGLAAADEETAVADEAAARGTDTDGVTECDDEDSTAVLRGIGVDETAGVDDSDNAEEVAERVVAAVEEGVWVAALMGTEGATVAATGTATAAAALAARLGLATVTKPSSSLSGPRLAWPSPPLPPIGISDTVDAEVRSDFCMCGAAESGFEARDCPFELVRVMG